MGVKRGDKMVEEGGVCRDTCSRVNKLPLVGIEIPREERHLCSVCAGFLRILAFFGYLLLFFLVWNGVHDFKKKADLVSAVNINIEGVLYSVDEQSIIDLPDYLVSKEVNSFAVSTKQKITKQKEGSCEEDPAVLAARCQNDSECGPVNTAVPHGHGLYTGRCIESSRAVNISVCEIYAWCPVENPSDEPPPVFGGIEKITFTVKNWIRFIEFEDENYSYKRNNFKAVGGHDYDLMNCFYNQDHPMDKYCPRITVEAALEAANQNINITLQGGIIGVIINWECELDDGIENCLPDYSFKRLDDKESGGWTIRKDVDHKDQTRDLIKTTGIQFIVRVSGIGWRSDTSKAFITLGSFAGIFGSITTVCVLLLISYKAISDRIFSKTSPPDIGLQGGTAP